MKTVFIFICVFIVYILSYLKINFKCFAPVFYNFFGIV